MAGPWEKYQQAPQAATPSGPWSKYGARPQGGDEFMIGGPLANQIRSGLAGVLEGVPVAGPALLGGAQRAAAGLSSLMGGPSYEQGLGQVQTGLEANIAANPMTNVGGQVAGAIGSSALLPGAAFSTLPRAIASGGAISGADITARSLAETGQLPSMSQVVPGTLFGAALGAGGYKLGQIMQRPKLDPISNQQVDTLASEGVNITAGQATGNKGLMRREAASPGASDFVEQQTAAFSRAALRRVGIDAPDGRLNPQMLDDAFGQVGLTLDGLAARNVIPPNTVGRQILGQMRTSVDDAIKEYHSLITTKPAGIIGDAQRKIARYMKTGIPGDEYAAMRSKLETNARKVAGSDPLLADALRKIRGAMDEAMDSSIKAFNPADSELWRGARRLYSNLLVFENAFSKAASAEGIISPRALHAATTRIKGSKLFARGLTDLDDLARAGVARLKPLPTGTSGNIAEIVERVARQVALSGAAATAGYYTAGIPGAVLGAIPVLASKARSALSLRPITSLYGQAAATGGKIGGMLGSLASAQGKNPFANLITEDKQQ